MEFIKAVYVEKWDLVVKIFKCEGKYYLETDGCSLLNHFPAEDLKWLEGYFVYPMREIAEEVEDIIYHNAEIYYVIKGEKKEEYEAVTALRNCDINRVTIKGYDCKECGTKVYYDVTQSKKPSCPRCDTK